MMPVKMFVYSKKRRKGDRLLLKDEMLVRVGISYQKVWRLMIEGRFPRSVNAGAKVAWYESEVDQWLGNLERTTLKGDEEVAS